TGSSASGCPGTDGPTSTPAMPKRSSGPEASSRDVADDGAASRSYDFSFALDGRLPSAGHRPTGLGERIDRDQEQRAAVAAGFAESLQLVAGSGTGTGNGSVHYSMKLWF